MRKRTVPLSEAYLKAPGTIRHPGKGAFMVAGRKITLPSKMK